VLISTEEQARIVEVVFGEVTREACVERPALRRRVVDICQLGLNAPQEQVVQETIQLFIEQETYESQVALPRSGTRRGSGALRPSPSRGNIQKRPPGGGRFRLSFSSGSKPRWIEDGVGGIDLDRC